MFVIENVYISPNYPDNIAVEWVVSNPSIDQDYLFNIYISEQPDGPYTKANKVFIKNETSYTFPYRITSKQEYFYIKVEAKLTDGSTFSEPTFFTSKIPNHIWLVIKEIVRKNDLLNKKFVGVPCLLKKKKVLGQNCTDCIDEGTGYVTNSRCRTCYGTRIVGGYLDAKKVIVEVVEQPREIKVTNIGTVENIVAQGRLTSPLLFKGDLLIEKQRNKRWIVNTVKRQLLHTFPVGQLFEIRQLSPKDIEYTI